MNCRHCGAPVEQTFIDLGFAPPSNAYLNPEDLNGLEAIYPLRTRVCGVCWLVQTEDYTQAEELFSGDYAYFSSTSTTWLNHAARYVAEVTERLQLTQNSFVVEIAANDGYLLKNFVTAGIPCLGIEPTDSTAAAAERLGVPVLRQFFGEKLGSSLAAAGQQADLIVGNNVFAHVPDINDFTRGLKQLLKPTGTITLEFPHLMQLVRHKQFDTIYHEHFSYLSLHTVSKIFTQMGLQVWDVAEIPTHGGSLRVYGCHAGARSISNEVTALLEQEKAAGLQDLSTYQGFQEEVDQIKGQLLEFLMAQKNAGKIVVGYGAAAKGNTLLNYAGVKPDLLPFICDAAPSKQGKLMPGSHIPIFAPAQIQEQKPDYVLILPWNLQSEIMEQLGYIRNWGGLFVTAIPSLKIW
jgi:SAM-dependent methyltransferase